MWQVMYLADAAKERDELPPRERQAIRNAVKKLEALGPDLPFPHSSDVRGARGLRELRPRGGRCAFRPLYQRSGARFLIAAIAPDGKSDPQGFAAACSRATDRLTAPDTGTKEEPSP
jgi:hypothetical protein